MTTYKYIARNIIGKRVTGKLQANDEIDLQARLKNDNVTYPATKLTKRLDKLAGLRQASLADGQNYIHDKIAASSFYKAQFGG